MDSLPFPWGKKARFIFTDTFYGPLCVRINGVWLQEPAWKAFEREVSARSSLAFLTPATQVWLYKKSEGGLVNFMVTISLFNQNNT